MTNSSFNLNDQMLSELIQNLGQQLVDIYVFPDIAVEMKESLQKHLSNGESNHYR